MMPMKIIDCDIHHTFSSQKDLYPYLKEPHLGQVKEKGLGYPLNSFHSSIHYKRLDAVPEIGPAGSDYDLMRSQLLDKNPIEFGLLTGEGISGVSYMVERDFPAALACAFNDWTIDTWLPRDPRLLGSLHLAIQNPEAAAAEIYRNGAHPRVVQINLPAQTPMPLSHPYYRPILRAAAEMDLVIALHFRQPGVNTAPLTPNGQPESYLDYHTLISLPYMSQLVSLVTSGVLEELPNLKILLMEGGFIWAIHLLWRIDKDYKSLYRQAPLLKKLPSEYIYKHFKFGVQPIYEPQEVENLRMVIEAGNLQGNLVYGSDYPHWDADSPEFVQRFLPKEWHEGIFYQNIADWYKISKK
jgi:uncharacterized protein